MTAASRRCRLGGPDAGVSEVVGSILMVAITVAVAAGMVTVVYGAVSGEDETHRASISASIHENDGGWGSGDETVEVDHEGGNVLPSASLAVVVTIDGMETRFTETGSDVLDHAGEEAFSASDTSFVIGERWQTPGMTIPPNGRVTVTVVDVGAGTTLWTGSLTAGSKSSSYVQVPLAMVTGTASNDSNARSASDEEAAATLTEASVGSSPATHDQYGTESSGTANNPENTEGAPDDQYAQFQQAGVTATVFGFPTETGTISQVELALEGRHDGGHDAGQTDAIALSHNLGSTTQSYPLTTTDAQHFLDVTSDRSWTWTDVQNLEVEARCECRDVGADDRQFLIDSLWARVTTTTTTYDLESDAWSFDTLGGSSPHTLEVRYRTESSETYEVQVWDGSTWNGQAPTLDQGSFTLFSEPLTSAEMSAGPQIRILGQQAQPDSQDTLELDYVGVVSS